MKSLINKKYLFVKQIVCDEGYEDEISWQSSLNYKNLDESALLKELAWVILSSGMKEQIIRNIFNRISKCFYYWQSSNIIVQNKDTCFQKAIEIFNHKNKILAIIDSAEKINKIGFYNLKSKIKEKPIESLRTFQYIGPVTVYHLAKNIGIEVAKPDRHLVRIAKSEGYSDVQEFCSTISESSGDSISVVDIVFWRFANLDPNYLDILSSIQFH